MCVLIPFLPAVTAHKARHVNDLLERKTGWGRSCEPSFSTDVENKKQRMLGIVKSRRDRD